MSVTIEKIRDSFSKLELGSTLLTGLVSFWKFNESSGDALDELSVYDGTLDPAATQGSAGKFSTSYTYNGASLQKTYFGTVTAALGTNDFSVSTWIYITDAGAGTFGVLGNWDDAPYFYITAINGNGFRVRFNFTGSNVDILYSGGYTINTWINLILTVDRDGLATLYKDNVSIGTADVSSFSGTGINNTVDFVIGSIGMYISGFYFNGRIDDTGVWSRLLTSGERITLQTQTYPFS